MLDSSLCPQTYSRWVALTSLISHTFANKAIPWSVQLAAIALLILAFALLVWLPRHPRWRRKFSRKLRWNRQRTRFVIACVIICLLIISPIGVTLANQVLVTAVPMTSNAAADAIVVLGRGPKLGASRIEVAAELWQAKRAPKIFVSGRGDAFLMIQQLKQKGVSEKALDGEECSMTTEGNAKFTAQVLIPKGVRRILLVTDPPHMLRSLLTFRSQGFQAIPFASPLPPELTYREKASIVFREYGGLISYVVWGRFFGTTEN